MKCSNTACGRDNRDEFQYCLFCGSPLPVRRTSGGDTVVIQRTDASGSANVIHVAGQYHDRRVFNSSPIDPFSVPRDSESGVAIRPGNRADLAKPVRIGAGAIVRASIFGAAEVTLEIGARITGDVFARRRLLIGAGVVLDGNIFASGDVSIGAGVHINGVIVAKGPAVTIGPGARVRQILASGNVTLEDRTWVGRMKVDGTLSLPSHATVSEQRAVVASRLFWPKGFVLVLSGGNAGPENVFDWVDGAIFLPGQRHASDRRREIISVQLSRDLVARGDRSGGRRP